MIRRLIGRVRGEADPESLVARGLTLGTNVYIGRSTVFDGGFLWLISVGDNSVISAGVEVLAHDASTRRHIGYSVVKPVEIGRRVYVGAGAIILPGTTIGDDSIIGAGSVVHGDVPAGSVAVGNPARVIYATAEYLERHRAQMESRPTWPAAGWTVGGGITDENKRRMREALRDGHGYVE